MSAAATTVLVVEDEESFVQALTVGLKREGFRVDVVVGLEVGADDSVSKPYRMRELVARVRATLRPRSEASAA